MIVIRMFRVVQGKKKKYAVDQKVIATFPNETDFGFDIGDPVGWKNFLRSFKNNGAPLPRKTEHGEPVCYNVCVFGRSDWMIQRDRGNFISLFPGYDASGELYNFADFGVI